MTETAEIVATGLFDAAWYARVHPDIHAAGIAPEEHYARFGEAEGRPPNAYFDVIDYRARAGHLGDMSPLLHYARHGEAADLAPGPNFDPAWYRDAYDLPRSTSALADFLRNRAGRRRLPCRELYVAACSEPYATLPGETDIFEIIVADRRRRALPTESAVIGGSALFDANHYLINGSDVHEAALDPIEHFCGFGWREGRQPNIYFNTAWYLRTNPEVERLGINPLCHYILEGEAGGRRPVVYFDPLWYRATYDVLPDRLALAHFLESRRSQTVSPNGAFDLAWYLKTYAQQVGPNRDPFAHYLQTGTYRDVWPAPDFDPVAWRRRTIGRRTRHFQWRLHPDTDNPLIRHLHETYR